jgi:hypothetical protein
MGRELGVICLGAGREYIKDPRHHVHSEHIERKVVRHRVGYRDSGRYMFNCEVTHA